MIISDLNYLEVVSESTAVQGGFFESDAVFVTFSTTNLFSTYVNTPTTYSNSAAAGAKGVANNNTGCATYSYTKADTLAVADYWGGSFAASTSAAVINAAH